jgi:hypothetical protein
VYNRGGYVWAEDSSEFAMLFLEEDWTGDRLPDDLVEEAGLLSSVRGLLKPEERAQWGGYARSGDHVLFSPGIGADFIEQGERVFLVGDLNQWDWSEMGAYLPGSEFFLEPQLGGTCSTPLF